MVREIKIDGIIPARMESTRFPSKPLALIKGMPMIEHVYLNTLKSKYLNSINIATDSNQIKSFCDHRSIPCIFTTHHDTGSDRVFEAASKLGSEYIINIQGDEPMVNHEVIDNICKYMRSDDFNNKFIITTHCDCTEDELKDPNNVKVVLSKTNNGLYYSRKDLFSGVDLTGKPSRFKQIGVYAYTLNTLKQFSNLGYSALEDLEKIEIMRWIDNGLRTISIHSKKLCYSVDTIEDLVYVENLITHEYRNYEK
tara:strand:+ start:5 stop:763 length:759 start_codon:yes stop_codon:yes gene_type:complete